MSILTSLSGRCSGSDANAAAWNDGSFNSLAQTMSTMSTVAAVASEPPPGPVTPPRSGSVTVTHRRPVPDIGLRRRAANIPLSPRRCRSPDPLSNQLREQVNYGGAHYSCLIIADLVDQTCLLLFYCREWNCSVTCFTAPVIDFAPAELLFFIY